MVVVGDDAVQHVHGHQLLPVIVIADHAAPEGIIQIKHQRFFVLPVDGLDDERGALRHIRDRIHGERILVQIPADRIVPSGQAVVLREKIKVVDIKIAVRLRVTV